MGMIASLKVGYRVKMSSGMKGLDYGGKATVLDAMKILQQLWEDDHKYAYIRSLIVGTMQIFFLHCGMLTLIIHWQSIVI